MDTQLLESVVAGEAPGIMPLTVDQYHNLLQAGIVHDGDPIELLDGFLIWKDRRDSRGGREIVHGPDHASTVNRLFQAIYERLVGTGCFAQCQLPIAIYPDSAPEPDVSVVLGRPQDYAGHLPNPNHVLAVFEVADGSLRLDRTNKLRLYANAGIPSYLVINLVSRTIEFCTKPVIGEGKYAETQMLGVDDSIRLELQDGRCVKLAVSEVF